jgi:ribosomal protein S18 acetylase RimI-like enzyme
MAGPRVEIRSAAPEELARVVATIVAAFVTDPFARFAWPAPHEHLLHMPRPAREFARGGIERGTVYVTADFCGAALWLAPGVHPDGEELERSLRETVPADRMDDLLETLERMGQSHPEEPHWYLPMVGVDPHAQGKGLGGALMRHALARCDEERAPAYLESTNPRNISLYERHGFEVLGRIQVGAGPLVTPMLRRPR